MKKSILFMLFLLSFSYSVFGQITVKGKVVDDTGESLPSATIQIKGTTRGTTTDIDGNFEIEVGNESDVLVVRFPTFIPLEIIALEANKTISLKSELPLEWAICQIPYLPLKVNYWSGLIHNPYGISMSKFWIYSFLKRGIGLDGGYSTNFKGNSDFYAEVESSILSRRVSYKFQQTTFKKSETENRITTHLIESSSSLKIVGFLYGIGHQTFSKEGIENSQTKNYGIHLGLSKNIKYIGTISAKSFYWQDYYAWEANLNKSIYYKKLRLNTAISYRQTTQDFKEVNLTLGYIF